jgi:TnpA family transposase
MAFKERIRILVDSEINDLYGPPKYSIEVQRLYFALNDDEERAVSSIRNRSHKCFFIVLLGYFKSKPVVLSPSFGEVESDLKFIAKELYLGFGIRRFSLTQKQKDRFYQNIFELAGHKKWDVSLHQTPIVEHLQQASKSWVEPRYLFDAAIEYLAQQRIAIPKYTVLQRIVSQAINEERDHNIHILKTAIDRKLTENIANLIDGSGQLTVKELRQSAKSFSAVELEKELKVHNLIQPLMDNVKQVMASLSLSIKNKQHFASMVDYYSITKLKRFDRKTQQLYLICYLQERSQQNIERLADGFTYHVRKLREQAQIYAKEAAYKDWEGAAGNVSKAAEILKFFIDDSVDDQQLFGDIKRQAHSVLGSREIESLCLYLNKQKRATDDYVWEYYDQQKELIKRVLRPIFLCLNFEGSDKTKVLVNQLSVTKNEIKASGSLSTADQELVQPKYQTYVFDANQKVAPQRYECLLYLLIQSKLHGQLYIPESIKYRALQDDLVRDEQMPALLKNSILPCLKASSNELINLMKSTLANKICQVNDRIDKGDNKNVILRSRTGKTKWRLPSSGVKTMLNNPFFDQIKQINISDVLRLVDKETEFLSSFEHVRQVQSEQTRHQNDLLAALIGNGTNYGLYGLANISDRSYEQLRLVQANYLRPETLAEASDMINNATAQLEIFKHYNIQEGVIHASADGQKFEARLESFKTRYSSKYFGTNKGVSALTLVANHSAINARVIGSNEHESHYIFDLLYSNSSDIKPSVLSTDTHGVNHVNFALLDLFGYTFAPRYAQFGDVIEKLFDVADNKEGKTKLSLKTPIKTQLIMEQWDTIQRIVISLQQKTVTQATLIRKLSGYSKNHPLLQALTEYNRMIKAMYLLDYIDDASLRGYVQRALNRGEAYHQLRRAIASVNGNRFRGLSDYEITLWNECARLLTNAIIYFNSLILTRLLTYFESIGDEGKLALTKKVSPVAWHNINLNGTYSFSFEEKLPEIEEIMRPLTERDIN